LQNISKCNDKHTRYGSGERADAHLVYCYQ